MIRDGFAPEQCRAVIAKVVNRESSVTIRDVSANPTRKQSAVRRSVAIGLLAHENSRWNIGLERRSCQGARSIPTFADATLNPRGRSFFGFFRESAFPRRSVSSVRKRILSPLRDQVRSLLHPSQTVACFSWSDLTSVVYLEIISAEPLGDALSSHRDDRSLLLPRTNLFYGGRPSFWNTKPRLLDYFRRTIT